MTTTASLGTWGQVGAGSMPNALVLDFDYDQASDRLFAGTFGRGAFSLPNASSVGGNLPPVASCVPVVERPAEAMCLAAITVFDVDAGSSDPDGPPPTCTLSPTGPFGPGTFTVTLTCVDSFGASDSCESTVIVDDVTPPAFTSVPADISTTTCGSPSLGTATATDNCDTTVTITNNAPAQFTPGTTLVTWTATDDAGNVSTATQRVTLILTDNQACCPAGTNILLGNSNNNTLNGTNGPDCILGRGAQDTINGNGGNDFISGGDGNDSINGGGGNDVIFGGSGQDPIIGGTGNDTIFGGDGDDNLQGGANDDILNGGQGQDTLLGQDGNDQLNGDDGDDNLQGGNDNDSLVGGTNNDTCNGGTGINTFAQCEFGAPNSCTNGVQDGTETDLNCGGACPKCPNGDLCVSGSDCQSGLCANGTVRTPDRRRWRGTVNEPHHQHRLGRRLLRHSERHQQRGDRHDQLHREPQHQRLHHLHVVERDLRRLERPGVGDTLLLVEHRRRSRRDRDLDWLLRQSNGFGQRHPAVRGQHHGSLLDAARRRSLGGRAPWSRRSRASDRRARFSVDDLNERGVRADCELFRSNAGATERGQALREERVACFLDRLRVHRFSPQSSRAGASPELSYSIQASTTAL